MWRHFTLSIVSNEHACDVISPAFNGGHSPEHRLLLRYRKSWNRRRRLPHYGELAATYRSLDVAQTFINYSLMLNINYSFTIGLSFNCVLHVYTIVNMHTSARRYKYLCVHDTSRRAIWSWLTDWRAREGRHVGICVWAVGCCDQ